MNIQDIALEGANATAALRTVPTWSIALGKAHTWPGALRAGSWAQSVKTAWKRS